MKNFLISLLCLMSQIAFSAEIHKGEVIAKNCKYFHGKINFEGVSEADTFNLVVDEIPSAKSGGFALLGIKNLTKNTSLNYYTIDSDLVLHDHVFYISMNDNADPEPSHTIYADISDVMLTFVYTGGYSRSVEPGQTVEFLCDSIFRNI